MGRGRERGRDDGEGWICLDCGVGLNGVPDPCEFSGPWMMR